MRSSAVQHNEGLVSRLQESASKFLGSVEKKFDLCLDYSEPSLNAVDIILSLFFKERRAYDLAVSLIGSYLGEVLIHNLGGKWEPTDLSVVKIGKMRGVAHPFRQARKRLEKGLGEALTGWYARKKMSFCHDGNLHWDGQGSGGFYERLISQNWDLKLLERVLSEDEKPYVREEAAQLLAKLKCSRVAPVLLEQLYLPETAYYACIAFQGIHDPKAIAQLRKLASENSDIAVRVQAIQAVGEHKDNGAIDLLMNMLSEQDEGICHYASQALARIGGERVSTLLLEVMSNGRPGNKVCVISALELMGDRVCVPYLIESLFNESEEVREAAARALQYLPDSRALKPLLFLLGDRSSRIRILAAYALVFLGDPQALEPLRLLVKDPVKDVRDHAAYLVPLLENGEHPAGFCW